MAQRFERLFQPGRIGTMEVRNRIVMPPMTTNFADKEGFITQRIKDYYEARARGGAGIVVVETGLVDSPAGRGYPCQVLACDDKFIPGLKELAEVIKRHGARATLQLHHAGRETSASVTGVQAVAPSPVPSPAFREVPRELTIPEIKDLIARFAQAAVRAKKAGFDSVEVHGAHGYLIAQFLSGAANKRTDEYGGELRNRARFLLEILQAVRKVVGKEYTVWCRINGCELMEGGNTVEDAKQVARWAEDTGSDAVHVSAYGYGSGAIVLTPLQAGVQLAWTREVKKVVGIPVIAVGRVTPELGEQFLKEGGADFISIGRALIADPELPNKVASGKLEDITPCISCLRCTEGIVSTSGESCSVNAAVGREGEYQRIIPAAKSKKVVVVGGGPAGMEAARVATLRGHKVTLVEKGQALGGQLIPAAVPPNKELLKDLADYLKGQMKKLRVKVVLGKEATPSYIDGLKPDAVVVAAGSIPIYPTIPGLDRAKPVDARRVLTGQAQVGERVLVIGGAMVGCETADYLAQKGKKVTLIEVLPRLAPDMMPMLRRLLMDRLREKRVTLLTGVKDSVWTDKGMEITTGEGQRQVIEADTVVIATGAKPDTDLVERLKGKGYEVHAIGDCVEARKIKEAVYDGSRIGRVL